ncbi:MAG: iron-sulfur cluster assembly accessory protein [Polaromonas sp.]|uniref:iron-sulfur cluster biosynthesis family protein n=1 Tax=Polaromonas sp. TaxID=1869339 RepID=UPI00183AB3AF|nr:iron-sulfur cluster biosynthesis family protein [Polaromonas sp.]NMM10967.1 iron-sulfur cluster assembly accessory protein [Polaromonas sp.]
MNINSLQEDGLFTLTSAAARQIQQAANASGAQTMALRIAARVDADGSMQYGMGFDDPKEEDMKLDLDGVAVIIADESQQLLMDTVLDYVELQPGEFNFIFMDGSQSPCASEQVPASGGCASGGCSKGGCGNTGRTH